ncbi:MAG TPA: hypothetical protein VIB80_04980 [Aquiluna sp.]
MKKSDLDKALALMGELAVSIYAPTHKSSPENQADPILLKNLVSKAQEQVLKLGDKRQMGPVLENLEAAFNSINFEHTSDGIALLVSENGFHTFNLSHSPNEQVSVGKEFSVAELAKTLSKSWEYHLLVLSESPTRLFRGDRDSLQEIKGSFPIEHTGRGGAQGLPTDFGQRTSVVEDEEHRKFFRTVADALTHVQADEKLPLVVTGVTRFQAFWADVAPSQAADLIIEGSYDFMSEAELIEKFWSDIQEHFRAENKKVIADLDSAKSQKRYAGGIAEVLEMATAGRIDTLVVSDDETANEEIEKAVRAVLESAGDVFFVPAEELEHLAPIAARLRF